MIFLALIDHIIVFGTFSDRLNEMNERRQEFDLFAHTVTVQFVKNNNLIKHWQDIVKVAKVYKRY